MVSHSLCLPAAAASMACQHVGGTRRLPPAGPRRVAAGAVDGAGEREAGGGWLVLPGRRLRGYMARSALRALTLVLSTLAPITGLHLLFSQE